MQHVHAKNIGYRGRLERKLLRIRHGIEPRTPNNIGGNHAGQRLFKESGSRAHLDGNTVVLAERKEARKEFLLVNAAQYRLLFPDAAMSAEILLRLSVNGHCL
jgi:hypothetical protein